MKKYEWGIVIVVVGAGILSQIPAGDDMSMTMEEQEFTMPAFEAAAGMEVVSLAITGMT